MNLQDHSKFLISILNQVTAFQKDGYNEFSFSPGLEKNDKGDEQECMVMTMALSAAAIKEDEEEQEEFKEQKMEAEIGIDEVFTPKPRNQTIIFPLNG